MRRCEPRCGRRVPGTSSCRTTPAPRGPAQPTATTRPSFPAPSTVCGAPGPPSRGIASTRTAPPSSQLTVALPAPSIPTSTCPAPLVPGTVVAGPKPSPGRRRDTCRLKSIPSAVACAQAATAVPSGATATEPIEDVSATSAPSPVGWSHVGAAEAGAARMRTRASVARRSGIVGRRYGALHPRSRRGGLRRRRTRHYARTSFLYVIRCGRSASAPSRSWRCSS